MAVTTKAEATLPDREPAPSASRGGGRADPLGRSPWKVAGWAVVITCAVVGIAVRTWFLTHATFNSDAAIVGLMARDALQGHFTTFFWGQNYGGAEPYVVAALFAVFGQSALALTATPAVLMVATALVTWRAARRLVADPLVAALAGALVWVMPSLGLASSTEYGFRNVALLCGVTSLLLGLRILDGHPRYIDVLGFGAVAGIGWWASPEITYFLFPATALLIGAIAMARAAPGIRFWAPRLVTLAVGFVVGALPWLWTNFSDGFQSLHTAPGVNYHDHGYLGHVQTFFGHALTLQLGLRVFGSGQAVIPGPPGIVVQAALELALVGAVILCMTRPGRARVIAVALLIFPLLYALNPLAWWWLDGRYGEYVTPLVALVLIIGFEQLPRLGALLRDRRPLHTRESGRSPAFIGMTGAVVVALALGIVAVLDVHKHGASIGLGGDPNAAADRWVAQLETAHVDVGYANYWVAYKLDFLSGGRLHFSPGPWDEVRSVPFLHRVESQTHQTWLFVPSSQLGKASIQFGTLNLETGFVTESDFLRALGRLGDVYTIVHAGVFDAIMPQAPVTPQQVGIPGSDTG